MFIFPSKITCAYPYIYSDDIIMTDLVTDVLSNPVESLGGVTTWFAPPFNILFDCVCNCSFKLNPLLSDRMIEVIVLEPVGISNGRAWYVCSFPFDMYKNWTQTELCQRINMRRGMSHSRPCYNEFRTVKGIFLRKFWNE